MKPESTFASFLVLAALGVATTSATAQSWPSKPIRLIAPSNAGGAPDIYARYIGEVLAKELGQPVVVENIPAAGGLIAVQAVMRAPADGHTLLVSTAGMLTITPHANKRAGFKPADLAPICQGVEAALVLVSNPSLPAKTFDELSKWMKVQNPAPSYSSYSPGTPAHFLGHQLGEAVGLQLAHIPYRSSPQQVTDMLGNTAPLGFAQIASAVPHIKSGKLTAYATTGATRAPTLPDVPTMKELGHAPMTATVWFGLSAPKGVPAAIQTQLVQLHQRISESSEFRARMSAASLTPSARICGDDFLKKTEAESAQWARLVAATGFSTDN